MSNSGSNVPQALRNLGVRNMNITFLDLTDENLTKLPESIGKLKELEFLYLDDNKLTKLPDSIGNLKNLTEIYCDSNNLTTLPESIGNLRKLSMIDLHGNRLTSLPSSFGNLKNLESLYLGYNNLTRLPPQICNLPKLESLYLSGNNLTILPPQIGNLQKLESLDLSGNNLTILPPQIGNLPKLKSLDLRGNPNLRNIPRSFYRPGLKIKIPIVLKPIVRRNVPLNTNRNDPISGYNFSVGNNALLLGGYNRYLTEKSFLNWIKTKNPRTNITNINTLYSLDPNTNIVSNPFTRQRLFRRNINFVKFVKPKPPNALSKNLNKTKINKKRKTPNKPNKPNTPNTIRKKAGNAAQSRRKSVNNNNR